MSRTNISMESEIKSYINEHGSITAEELSIDANDPNLLRKATEKWKRYGCFVVRGLNKKYVESISRQVKQTADQSIALEKAGMIEKIKEGWVTPDGTLFIPSAWDGTEFEKNRMSVVIEDVAETDEEKFNLCSGDSTKLPAFATHPDGSPRTKQIMVLGLDYNTSSALLRCAMDDTTLDVVSAIIEAESENQFESQNIEKEVSNECLRNVCIFFKSTSTWKLLEMLLFIDFAKSRKLTWNYLAMDN